MEKEEKPKPQVRHTHKTAAGLEDAIAVLLDALRHIFSNPKYAASRIAKAIEILRITRRSPNSYDPNRPAGPRKLDKR